MNAGWIIRIDAGAFDGDLRCVDLRHARRVPTETAHTRNKRRDVLKRDR
jgi:hypothetical protein